MAFNRTYYFNYVSNSGLTYRLEMYDQVASATFQDQEGTLGPKASEISYGSDGSKMFAPIKASSFSFEFMVNSTNAGQYIMALKTERQERDVYVALYRESVSGANSPIYSPVWAGQVLMDLSDDPDIPMPYPITIKAVDGIASLKYYDYIPETTSQTASNLYEIQETYISDPLNSGGQYSPWQQCTEIISNCLLKSGAFTSTQGNPGTPRFRTSSRWFNGQMPNTSVDPLHSSRIKPDTFYEIKNQENDLVKYKAQNCYDVIKSLCEAWGMRLYYWRNAYYLTQLSAFEENETGNQSAPANIRSHNYNLDGSTISVSNGITGFWGTYVLYLDNRQITTQIKNLKLSGGSYGLLPALKKVTVDFLNVDNVNRFQCYPPIALQTTWNQTANSPVTDPNFIYYTTTSLGTYTFDGVNEQSFFMRINLNIQNNSAVSGMFKLNWGLAARPVSSSNSSTPGLNPAQNGATWMITDVNGYVQWMTPLQWAWYGTPWNDDYFIQPGSQTVEITNNSVGQTFPTFPPTDVNDPLIPQFTAGDWEILIYTKTLFGTSSPTLQGWGRHGRFSQTGGGASYNPYDNNISYTDVAATQGIGASEFAPIINGAIGSAMITTNLVQTGDDTSVEEITNVIMGDTGNNQSEGAIQIYNGTQWIPSDFSGVWGIDTLAGGNSFSQQLATDIFKAQAESIDIFTVETTMNAGQSIYFNDGFANRPQYPAPFTKFNTLTVGSQVSAAKQYIMHTGTFDVINDTWKWKLYQQERFATGGTTTTNNTGGIGSGPTGGGGIPEPDGGNYNLRTANPGANNILQINRLQRQSLDVVATISANQYIAISDNEPLASYDQTITSLNVQKLFRAVFKTGDKIVLQTQSIAKYPYANEVPGPTDELRTQENRIDFIVSADQLAGATSISVVSKRVYQSIQKGDTITINTENLISQYQNKTEGSIAGFEVDADGLTKGGVEITGWLDSDTMTGATANNVPTAESVKAYVDASAGGTTPTLQEVTTAGNTTTNQITIPATPIATTDAASKGYVDAQSSTALSVFSMLICTTTTITQALNGVANAVIMKFDNESITEGPTGDIVSYGALGVPLVALSEYCWMIKADPSALRYFEFQWNVTSNTNTVNNRILSGIRLQTGVVVGKDKLSIAWNTITPTTSYIYDRGTGSIRKGSTAGSILISMPGGTSDRYYRMIFWREATSNNGVKSESVLNGTQMTIKQLK